MRYFKRLHSVIETNESDEFSEDDNQKAKQNEEDMLQQEATLVRGQIENAFMSLATGFSI